MLMLRLICKGDESVVENEEDIKILNEIEMFIWTARFENSVGMKQLYTRIYK